MRDRINWDYRNLSGRIILDALSGALQGREFQNFLDNNDIKDLEVAVLVNGVEYPFNTVIQRWEDAVAKTIENSAKEMVRDKIEELDELIAKFKQAALSQLGINEDDLEETYYENYD